MLLELLKSFSYAKDGTKNLADLDWSAPGAYRQGVAELSPTRIRELLADVRRASRDTRGHRRGADGKPQFRGGQTLGEVRAHRNLG